MSVHHAATRPYERLALLERHYDTINNGLVEDGPSNHGFDRILKRRKRAVG